jgi:anti-sigma-K factor RskA
LVVAVPRGPAGPGYVAVLRAPHQDQAAWVATTSDRGFAIRPLARAAPPNARAYELWTIAPGSSRPQPVGVIPADGNLALKSSPAALSDGATLAISVEPVGGSPTGQPTGPVVFSGAVIRTS